MVESEQSEQPESQSEQSEQPETSRSSRSSLRRGKGGLPEETAAGSSAAGSSAAAFSRERGLRLSVLTLSLQSSYWQGWKDAGSHGGRAAATLRRLATTTDDDWLILLLSLSLARRCRCILLVFATTMIPAVLSHAELRPPHGAHGAHILDGPPPQLHPPL